MNKKEIMEQFEKHKESNMKLPFVGLISGLTNAGLMRSKNFMDENLHKTPTQIYWQFIRTFKDCKEYIKNKKKEDISNNFIL